MTGYKHPHTDVERDLPQPALHDELVEAPSWPDGWRRYYRLFTDEELAGLPTPTDFAALLRAEVEAAGLEIKPGAYPVLTETMPADGGVQVSILVRGDVIPPRVRRRLIAWILVALAAAAMLALFLIGPPASAALLADDAPVVALSASRSGVATYCAPTLTRCQSWGEPAMLGAVQSFRWGDDPYRVEVCLDGTAPCATVTVVSYCACGPRNGVPTVIDLSPAAFRQLAPLSRGVIPVTVTGLARPRGTLPPTDTEEPA
jgi:hypothetical protein